jgi:toxin FitB
VTGFLLNTNCISELIRPRPEARVIEWLEAANEELLYLSVLTLGEIRKGAVGLSQGNRRSRVESWLEVELKGRFRGRILPIDEGVADRWGWLAARAKKRGRPLSVVDGLLAATALQHNMTVVSRNTADFSDSGVAILNLWQQ